MKSHRSIRLRQSFFGLKNERIRRIFGQPSLTVTALAASLLFMTSAQSVTLPELLHAAATTHPTVQSARLSVSAATEDVEAANRQYWPTLSATLEQGRTTSLEGPSRILRADQTLWDFGRTKANVAASEHAADAATAALEGQQQTIGLQVIEAWRSLQASHGRMQISEEMLKRLQLHESMMLRRVDGELSTQVDLDLVRSRILQGRVEVAQARTGIKVAITRLQNLTGLADLGNSLTTPPPLPSRPELDSQFQLMLNSIDWDDAASRQPTVVRAREEFRAGEERLNAKSAEAFPQIYARLDQAVSGRRETAAYLGIRYSPGAGFATAVEAGALAARALSLEQSIEAARIEAKQTLDIDRDDFRDNRVRAQALDAAVQGAQRVFESYERQFTAGRKSWVDLLNAVREVAQNAYSLVDAHTAQATALYRLQLRANPELIDVAVAGPGERQRMDAVSESTSRVAAPASAAPDARLVGQILAGPFKVNTRLALNPKVDESVPTDPASAPIDAASAAASSAATDDPSPPLRLARSMRTSIPIHSQATVASR